MLTLNVMLIMKPKDVLMYSCKQHNIPLINFLTFFHFKTSSEAKIKVNMPFFCPQLNHICQTYDLFTNA